MPTDFSSDKLQDHNEPEKNNGTWSGMAKCVSNRPGLAVLDRWIDDSLEKLEEKFAGFSTPKSIRRDFGR